MQKVRRTKSAQVRLTDEEVNKIADKVIEKLEARVGRATIKRISWFVGLVASALISFIAVRTFGNG